MNKSCAYCGGPMPPRSSPLGRPPIYCSLMCRRNHQYTADHLRWEQEAREAAERRAREDAERGEARRQANLAAGGTQRLEQLQSDAQDAGRCGWFEPGDDDVCQRRVNQRHLWWCREHMDREEQLEEEASEAEWAELEEEEKREGRRAATADPPHDTNSRVATGVTTRSDT